MYVRFMPCIGATALFLTVGLPSWASPDGAVLRVGAEALNQDKSPDQVFERMRKAFRPDKAKGAHVRYQFHLRAPQAADWWILVNDGAFTMGKGVVEHPDVTFSCTGNDWVELSNGTLGGIRAYLTGRLHVAGSQFLARKLDDMFP